MSQLHVIAVSRSMNASNELDAYVYSDNDIFYYSSQEGLEIGFNYSDQIKEIAEQVTNKLLEWTDFWIYEGQKITRQNSDVCVDNERIKLFSKLSKKKFSNIGPITSKIYNEFIRSRQKDSKDIKELLKESFEKGVFSSKITDIVEDEFDYSIEEEDLNDLDKQIIVRTKIEGYDFIINFIKNILHSEEPNKLEYCEIFLSRVFMLESQNFIKV